MEQDLLKVGIFFGGSSREREISFAGGRTVYDNLDKSLFEAVPIFVDSFNNFILINWECIYKGSIRDFFPSGLEKPYDNLYVESICSSVNTSEYHAQVDRVGRLLTIEELKANIDFAFLCLHGNSGEDGSIQGLLEFYGIPYSGSGIFASAFGMNKSLLNRFFKEDPGSFGGYEIKRTDWIQEPRMCLDRMMNKVDFPLVVRPAHQGSSIGVSIVKEPEDLMSSIDRAFFQLRLNLEDWKQWSQEKRIHYVVQLADIRNSLGYPVSLNHMVFRHPQELKAYLDHYDAGEEQIVLFAQQTEQIVLLEKFIHGREFSCIVILDINGEIQALPPTEIKKGKEVYDYRSKYMPGLSRKETPMDLPAQELEKIQTKAKELFAQIGFNVYARIDGFYTDKGEVILNDPNTTSGMLPSSFFFHQAAEVGWTPSGFISFIIGTSLRDGINRGLIDRLDHHQLLDRLNKAIEWKRSSIVERKKVAVLLGGYSTERHISLESGRNIFEKLNSSRKYRPEPIFLTQEQGKLKMFKIPIQLLLKDNADDIKESLGSPSSIEAVEAMRNALVNSVQGYQIDDLVDQVEEIDFNTLKEAFDFVFIALHGRPGEDGAIQKILESHKIPFNGSSHESAALTINKFETLEVLRGHGFKTAQQWVLSKEAFLEDAERCIFQMESNLSYPFIAKPLDDGCSSAVKMIKNKEHFQQYLSTIFRSKEEIDPKLRAAMNLNYREEFPQKNEVLLEELIVAEGANHFMEITGGLMTSMNKHGEISYRIFAPSESIAQMDILSIEEKFLAGEGMNITPPRYSKDQKNQLSIDGQVRSQLEKAAKILNVEGYSRIDAFVRIFDSDRVELIIIEVNSLPGMTPATAIFHQAAHEGMKPYDFIDRIIEYGLAKHRIKHENPAYK